MKNWGFSNGDKSGEVGSRIIIIKVCSEKIWGPSKGAKSGKVGSNRERATKYAMKFLGLAREPRVER